MQLGNSTQFWVDAAGQLNSMFYCSGRLVAMRLIGSSKSVRRGSMQIVQGNQRKWVCLERLSA